LTLLLAIRRRITDGSVLALFAGLWGARANAYED
jgi:hypothetical protein